MAAQGANQRCAGCVVDAGKGARDGDIKTSALILQHVLPALRAISIAEPSS